MSEEEDWLKAAVADDSLVVRLLLQISHSSPPPPKSLPPPPPPLLPVGWSVRQRRSKSISLKSSAATARASPTTPLSWSAATSHSGGFEESSQPHPRSNNKVSETSEAIRPKKRKRKTKIELKEEEAVLLKERNNLKKKISTMHVALKEERATNESLKRMKIELTMQAAAKGANDFAFVEPDSTQTLEMQAASDANPFVLPQSVISNGPAALPELAVQDSYLEVRKEVANYENKFALPDLNVALVESVAEILYVTS